MTDNHDDLATTRDADPKEVEYMFAQTASGLDIADGRVTLKGVSATTLRRMVALAPSACETSV